MIGSSKKAVKRHMFPHLASIGFAGPMVDTGEFAEVDAGKRVINTEMLLEASRKARLPMPKLRQDDPTLVRRTAVEKRAALSQTLFRAAKEGDLRRIRFALNRGARVNSVDSYGNTPLHLAAGGGHIPAVKLLLTAGAIRTAVNKMGHTPADRAAITNNPVTVKVLQTAGYSETHKRREFVRNLVRGSAALPSADDIIKLSGGTTDAGASDAEAKRRLATGPPIPSMMKRLLIKAGYTGEDVDNLEQRRFVRGMMKDVPMERPGDPSVRDVYRRFGADFQEYLQMKQEAKRAGRDLTAMARGEYAPPIVE